MNTAAVIGIREQGALELILALLRQGLTVRLRVSGISMLPLIQEGDVVEVTPLCEKKIRRGDIVFFCDHQGNPFIHRLHRLRYDSKVLHLQTKGDACAGYDPAVPVNQVYGQVRRIIITDRKIITLQNPFSFWQSRFLVARTAILFCLRRIKMVIIKE